MVLSRRSCRCYSALLPGWLLLLVLCACTGSAESPAATPTAAADTAAIWAAWQGSPHADTYGLEKGPNTYCARCHSPRNWDPQATIDPPPNCVSCKFEHEHEPRIAAGNPLVPETEWHDIGCEVCHPATEDGVDGTTIAWLDGAGGTYEAVPNATALCEHCHRDTETLRHERDLSPQVHPGFACVDCHDPHSTVASCTATGCHHDSFTPADPVAAHDRAHQSLTCVACHDAAELPAKPVPGEATWATFRTTELLGRSTTRRYYSHALQRAADCDRCHYRGNQWDLDPAVQEGLP